MKQEQIGKCVMCRKTDLFVTDKGTVARFFIAPQTRETLCSNCNSINDGVAKSRNDLREGKRKLVKIK